MPNATGPLEISLSLSFQILVEPVFPCNTENILPNI